MVEEAIEDSGGEGRVVVEDTGPVFVGGVGGDDDGATFIAGADDLEEEVGGAFVHGEITEFIDDEEAGGDEGFESLGQGVGGLGGGEGVDDLDGGGKEGGDVVEAGVVSEGEGEMCFAEADAAEEDDIGVEVDEAEAEEVLDLGAVDRGGPGPVELIEGLEHGEASGLGAAEDAAIVAGGGFEFGEAEEEVDVAEAGACGVEGHVLVVLGDGGEAEAVQEGCELVRWRFHRGPLWG